MVDVVKFNTPPLCCHRDVVAAATELPFVTAHSKGESKFYSAPYLKVELGGTKSRFGTLMFLIHPDGAPRLTTIEANLPKLLYGHNGRLIKTQEELVLGLSILRWMVGHFVSPAQQAEILPGLGRGGHVARIEIALQIWDPLHDILLASHLTGCRGFRKASLIAAGESTTHLSKELEIAFYDKHKQLKEGTVFPPLFCCTRIETRFRSSTRLIRGAGISTPKAFNRVATFSFPWLFQVFGNTLTRTLVGTLAKAKLKPGRNLRSVSRKILDLADPIYIHTALYEHQRDRGRNEGSRTKCEVFDELSRRYYGSLEEILSNGYPKHILSEIHIPAIELDHQVTASVQGWPQEAYAEVGGAFSKTMYLDASGEPRHFVPPE